MGQNEEFINSLKMEDVPWGQLSTAYGCAGEFPEHFAVLGAMADRDGMEHAFGEIAQCIEHQGTLWHCTPFALIFLVRIYREAVGRQENKNAVWLTEKLEELFTFIVICCEDMEKMAEGGDEDEILPLLSDMLKEEYLWPEDLDEDEQEELLENGYQEELFASCYHYSYELVREFADE